MLLERSASFMGTRCYSAAHLTSRELTSTAETRRLVGLGLGSAMARAPDWFFKLPSSIQAKFLAVWEGRKTELLTLEECRMVVRTIQIMMLLQPATRAKFEVNLNRLAGLARGKRRRARTTSNMMILAAVARAACDLTPPPPS